jgi:hypothetical protein
MVSTRQGHGSSQQTFVLVDTSVWRAQPLLRTPLGDALIHYVRRTGSKIALPEVVELEVTKQLFRAVSEARLQAENSFGVLQRVMGQMPEFKLPSDEEAREAIKQRLDDLVDIIERVPFSLEHARGALQRVFDETPPNAPKNQQFKDSAIWEAARELAGRRPVLFVTDDKGFFEGRDPTKGVARVLREEIDGGVDIRVFYGLRACLEAVQDAVPMLDRDAVAKQLDEMLTTQVNAYLARDGWVATEPSAIDLDVFATGHPSQVTLSFRAEYPLGDLRPDENRMSPAAIVQATGTYDLKTNKVIDVILDALNTEWTDSGGERRKSVIVFARAAIAVGVAVNASASF